MWATTTITLPDVNRVIIMAIWDVIRPDARLTAIAIPATVAAAVIHRVMVILQRHLTITTTPFPRRLPIPFRSRLLLPVQARVAKIAVRERPRIIPTIRNPWLGP